MSVIDFAKAKEDRETITQLRGTARCMACKRSWEAITPVGTVSGLECPECGSMKGCFLHEVIDGDLYVCNRGNDLMRINRAGCYCANCGAPATF